ncbi:hypothetical protein C2S53_002625 [Perilla frutescens var. hirtella]|uniref:Retrotransposon gag domain-containing protein n=1 Tax=Perilla frutescens var. hirtella TaxID=608512 RepID=A0AAD4NZJ1_PERFH|nr:hypothetical protein C2S53_002625 [Perilla frutescens var. hirtella]
MKPGDGNNKKNDKTPSTPNTPTDASSSDHLPWDAQWHYKAMSQHFERLQNEAAPRQAEVPAAETADARAQPVQAELARVEARANTRALPQVPRRQQQVQVDYHEDRDAEDDYGDLAEESEPEFELYQRRDRPRQPYRRAAHLYLDWERKVNKIFDCYDFPEVKKVQLAFMEFTGYAADWWENIQGHQCRNRYPPIDTWQEMKDIHQGTRSIEEYHKKLETAMNRVRKEETLIAIINRYIEGMHPGIACEVELKDFTSIEAMIHYASIVERQLKEGRRRPSQSTPARTLWVRGESSTLRTAPTHPQGQLSQLACHFEQSAPQPTRRPEYSSSVPSWNNQNRTNELESASEEELDEVEAARDATQSLENPPVDEIEDEKPKQAYVSLVSIRALSLI